MMSVAKTVVGTVVGMICTAMLAYVLSRKDFYFKKPFTILFIITMYVSGGLLPEYLLLTRTLNLGNNFWVYIIPGLIWVYNVILMRSFIEGLPIALQEAAKLDGANDFTIWLKVILPLCTPTIATVALFLAVGQWNSFMDTYLYARELPTLQYVLYQIMELIDMTELIDEYGPNIKKMYGDEFDKLKYSQDDPAIYQLCSYDMGGTKFEDAGTAQIQFNVLKENNYEAPKSLEEFEKMIKDYLAAHPKTEDGMDNIGFSLSESI